MTHADVQADLSLYALGTLELEERAEVEHHLAQGCAECERELIAWRNIVGSLGLGDEASAAPDLKPQLMGQLRPATEAVTPLPPRQRRTTWIQIGLPLAAAATMALYAVLREADRGGSLRQAQEHVAQLQGELDRNAKQAANLQTKVDSQQQEVLRLTGELAAKERNVESLRTALAAAEASLSVMRNPGLQMVRLTHTPDAPRREAHALINRASGRAIFYAFDLKPTSPDKAYELWWITEKKGPVKAGVFRPDARGLGRVEGPLPSDAGALQAAAVTIEPAAGVEKPTGPMILLGKLVVASAAPDKEKDKGKGKSKSKPARKKPQTTRQG